ncbi:hypothetical protein DIPPA_12056 [Diplonema papillatum]|nr:hypothetical protein DIPPA_12056 [Diplonema papillatum]
MPYEVGNDSYAHGVASRRERRHSRLLDGGGLAHAHWHRAAACAGSAVEPEPDHCAGRSTKFAKLQRLPTSAADDDARAMIFQQQQQHHHHQLLQQQLLQQQQQQQQQQPRAKSQLRPLHAGILGIADPQKTRGLSIHERRIFSMPSRRQRPAPPPQAVRERTFKTGHSIWGLRRARAAPQAAPKPQTRPPPCAKRTHLSFSGRRSPSASRGR